MAKELIVSQPNFVNVFLPESEIKTGLYVEAFCNGVDEVLETYRNEVQKLEGNFLENPQLPLMWVNGNIEKFVTLFIVLEEMIEMIKQEKLHGCLIMDKLLSYANCGISLVVDATYRYYYYQFL